MKHRPGCEAHQGGRRQGERTEKEGTEMFILPSKRGGMSSPPAWRRSQNGRCPLEAPFLRKARSFDHLTPARSANIKDVNIKDVLGPLCRIRADVPACGRATSAAISTINFLQVPIAHFTPRKHFLYLLHLTVDCKLCRETPVQELMYFNLRGAYFVDNKFEVFHVETFYNLSHEDLSSSLFISPGSYYQLTYVLNLVPS